jgi:hypothetical protein
MKYSGSKSQFVAILKTGFLAGTCDITCAMIHYSIRTGNNPFRILNFVSSAVFGDEALQPGPAMPVAGLLFHYTIATLFAAFFFWLYPRMNVLSKNIVASGIGYGVFVWLVMNLVVVPLSKIGRFPSITFQAFIGFLIIICAIGLPIAIMTYRYFINRRNR